MRLTRLGCQRHQLPSVLSLLWWLSLRNSFCLGPTALLYTALTSVEPQGRCSCAMAVVARRFGLLASAATLSEARLGGHELCGVLIGHLSISALYVRTDVAAEQTQMLQSVVKMFSNGHGLPGFAPEH